jgi:hypothetical protein
MIPYKSGLEITQQNPAIPVIIVSALGKDLTVIEELQTRCG